MGRPAPEGPLCGGSCAPQASGGRQGDAGFGLQGLGMGSSSKAESGRRMSGETGRGMCLVVKGRRVVCCGLSWKEMGEGEREAGLCPRWKVAHRTAWRGP